MKNLEKFRDLPQERAMMLVRCANSIYSDCQKGLDFKNSEDQTLTDFFYEFYVSVNCEPNESQSFEMSNTLDFKQAHDYLMEHYNFFGNFFQNSQGEDLKKLIFEDYESE